MRTIYKYTLDGGLVPHDSEVVAPVGAVPLFVGMQAGKVRVWMLVNTLSALVRHSFLIRGTGHDCSQGRYIGTTYDREYVWHVFYGGELYTPKEAKNA